MYDVFFISYDEPHADEAYALLRQQNSIARRVHGVEGIHLAHRRCAELSRTPFFFVVDADNRIDDPSVFSYRVPDYDASYVHLWYARNPLNGLAYGWGGLKLFPKGVFAGLDAMPLDMTTTFSLKIIPTVVSTAHFNSSPLETWRSAFREAVKLRAAPPSRENRDRLYGWCNIARGRFADYCLRGAEAGVAFADLSAGDAQSLQRINDYTWLQEQFSLSTARAG